MEAQCSSSPLAELKECFIPSIPHMGLVMAHTPHGLRKAHARRAAESGCTPHQIAAMTGHETLKEIERYTKAADRKKMAKVAMDAQLVYFACENGDSR